VTDSEELQIDTNITAVTILLVVIGLFWYGTKAGWFSMEWFRPETFWPSVVVVVGVCMVGAGLIKAKRRNT